MGFGANQSHVHKADIAFNYSRLHVHGHNWFKCGDGEKTNYSRSINGIKQTAITAKFYSVESGINNYQTLFQLNFCKQSSVQPQS